MNEASRSRLGEYVIKVKSHLDDKKSYMVTDQAGLFSLIRKATEMDLLEEKNE